MKPIHQPSTIVPAPGAIEAMNAAPDDVMSVTDKASDECWNRVIRRDPVVYHDDKRRGWYPVLERLSSKEAGK